MPTASSQIPCSFCMNFIARLNIVSYVKLRRTIQICSGSDVLHSEWYISEIFENQDAKIVKISIDNIATGYFLLKFLLLGLKLD